ncbi:hypothetical protein AB1Y20_011532 [Prymnesium parvum]|uniref:Protein xylosyltransferase n=1 Tax=Prymnesium parvum TaxID=97485 RepID=A0AB34IGP8_PRYPA
MSALATGPAAAPELCGNATTPDRPPCRPYAARVITFANTAFLHVLANFIAHMHHHVREAPLFEVHAMDDATFVVCTRMLHTGLRADRCVRPACCNWTHGFPEKYVRYFVSKLLRNATERPGADSLRLYSPLEVCRRWNCSGLTDTSGADDSFIEAAAAAARANAGVMSALLEELRQAGRFEALRELDFRLARFQQFEAITMYKIIAAYRLLRQDPTTPVLVLDATSLVSTRECFDELLRYPEDMIVSSEPKRGCPVAASFKLGAVGNTGAMFLRSSSLAFLRAMLVNQRGRYQNSCFEQEAFNRELLAGNFVWTRFPLTGKLPRRCGQHPTACYDTLRVRFLNYSHWPRNFVRKRKASVADDIWFAESPDKACLFHPYIRDKKAHAATYASHGRWYL